MSRNICSIYRIQVATAKNILFVLALVPSVAVKFAPDNLTTSTAKNSKNVSTGGKWLFLFLNKGKRLYLHHKKNCKLMIIKNTLKNNSDML